MNAENVTRQAIRLAQRQSKKRGIPLTKEEVLKLKVQTVEPWKRVLLAVIGTAFCGLGVVGISRQDTAMASVALLFFGLLIVCASIIGWRKSVEGALNGVDPTALFDRLF